MGSENGTKISGGVAGSGLDKNIIDCYRFIIHNYTPGDKLYFFGFSRGAYTVRSLAGLIRNCGILKREHAGKIEEAYEYYRDMAPTWIPDGDQAKTFRLKYAVADISTIQFVGVWDTVGALGIPWKVLLHLQDKAPQKKYVFHDTQPSKIVLHARHAVSIDEDREFFRPTLWENTLGQGDVQQVWFAGVHTDVGGGYPEAGLGDCAAQWMLEHAEHCGLQFEPYLKSALHPDPCDRQHKERPGPRKARVITPPSAQSLAGPLHHSVKARWDNSADYRNRCKPLNVLLNSVNGDWNRIAIV